ncbi:MAG: cupin domain-containing protein [Actinomycetota bacterium]
MGETPLMHSFDPVAVAHTREPFDFHEFAPFNERAFAVFRGDGVEASEWEIHRDTDEFLFVLAGSVTVEILTDDASEEIDLVAGQFAVVPRGHWHRHRDIVDLVEMYFTPGGSEQSDAEDPRLP